jgi:hypothetical protein
MADRIRVDPSCQFIVDGWSWCYLTRTLANFSNYNVCPYNEAKELSQSRDTDSEEGDRILSPTVPEFNPTADPTLNAGL